MSFKRFDEQDLVISAESISSPAWTSNAVQLTSFFTGSQAAGSSAAYYYNIYNNGGSNQEIQYSIAYGNKDGGGSLALNTGVLANSPSSIIYKQYRTLVNGTEELDFIFGEKTSKNIFPISVERARYKEKILPGSLALSLKDTTGKTITLTDNSNQVTTETFTDAGRVYELVSGSQGVISTALAGVTTGYTNGSGSYGKLLPDVGLILLNGDALNATYVSGGINLGLTTTSNTAGNNILKAHNAISSGSSFYLRSEETVSSNFVFVRARNSEFNYSTNPSNITGSGELRHNSMIDSPQSYITAVGLYNDNNDLLAVAKLSRPLLKDFTKEALVRIKLDY